MKNQRCVIYQWVLYRMGYRFRAERGQCLKGKNRKSFCELTIHRVFHVRINTHYIKQNIALCSDSFYMCHAMHTCNLRTARDAFRHCTTQTT